MEENEPSNLWLSEAIDIVGRHTCPEEWQGTKSLTDKNIRDRITKKFKEIIASGEVTFWYIDDQDVHQQIQPHRSSKGALHIALLHNAFSIGKNGRWYEGIVQTKELMEYLGEPQFPRQFSAIEDFLRDAMDKADATPGRKMTRSKFFELAEKHFVLPGYPPLAENQIRQAWQVVVSEPKYSKWAKPGRREKT